MWCWGCYVNRWNDSIMDFAFAYSRQLFTIITFAECYFIIYKPWKMIPFIKAFTHCGLFSILFRVFNLMFIVRFSKCQVVYSSKATSKTIRHPINMNKMSRNKIYIQIWLVRNVRPAARGIYFNVVLLFDGTQWSCMLLNNILIFCSFCSIEMFKQSWMFREREELSMVLSFVPLPDDAMVSNVLLYKPEVEGHVASALTFTDLSTPVLFTENIRPPPPRSV